MPVAMVTGRMDSDKKERVSKILHREGLNVSQVINLIFDRIEEENTVQNVLDRNSQQNREESWSKAAEFIDSLSSSQETRFDNMTKAEIKTERLKSRGLM